MAKTIDAFKFVWKLLLDGYGVAVALIAEWPHVAFWLLAALAVFAVQ